MAREGRLPPGQSLTHKFPVLDLGRHPAPDLERWELRMDGAVSQEVRLGWKEFLDLPKESVQMDIHCVTQWSKFETVWEGISLKTLVNEGILKLKNSARYVLQHAADDYTTNLPLSVVLQESFLLATHVNGAPLTLEHGYPVRAVIGHIPGREDLFTPYLWKGAKWVTRLEFLEEDRPGFWEQNGYSNEADVWKEERLKSGLW